MLEAFQLLIMVFRRQWRQLKIIRMLLKGVDGGCVTKKCWLCVQYTFSLSANTELSAGTMGDALRREL